MSGNHWFVDRLDEDDENYDPAWPWGIFLQIEGRVVRLDDDFATEADAMAFIRDEIIGAPASPEN